MFLGLYILVKSDTVKKYTSWYNLLAVFTDGFVNFGVLGIGCKCAPAFRTGTTESKCTGTADVSDTIASHTDLLSSVLTRLHYSA
jgi:hypothetical protein